MIKKHWWKALAVLLVFYSLFMGMLVPLRMGIVTDKTDLTMQAGKSQSLKINCYNARFQKEQEGILQARVRVAQDKAICASKIEVLDQRNLQLTFDLPALETDSIKDPFPLLEIGGDYNGYTFSSLFIKSNDNPELAEADFCEVQQYPAVKKTTFPFLNILEETIRNLYYHVPMWFGMMLIFLISVIYSIRQLGGKRGLQDDIWARAFAGVGVMFGILGLVTGAVWAKHTWGAYWSWDVKQNSSAVVMLIYLAYFVLRSSFDDADKRARIAAVYNIFAFATIIPLLYIIPRMVDSLHPGAEGNPAFSSYDLDNTMRLVFYPSVIAWMLMGVWFANIWARIDKLKLKAIERLNY
jgi:heme exporter protein C